MQVYDQNGNPVNPPQNQNVNPVYVQYQGVPQQPAKEPMSVGAWLITLLITSIPILNIIMLFNWAFGGNKDERENYSKAALLWMLICIILSICLVGCVGCAALAALDGMDL